MHLPKSTEGTTPRVKLNICYGLGPNVSYRLWCISVNSSVLTNVPVWWKMFLMRMALCVSVQFSRSVMSDSLRPHESQHARPPCPSPTPRVYSNSCPSSWWCHPAISSSAIPISSCPESRSFPSIMVFSIESTLRIRWPKFLSLSFSINPSNKHPELISFRMDWLDILAVQGTLKSPLQHHSSKASIFWCSAFFTFQLSHPYMTTDKTITLTGRTFVGKVLSLLFNIPSRLVITFLPRSKCLLISWLQSPSAVILEPPKIKSDTVSNVSPSNCHEVMAWS